MLGTRDLLPFKTKVTPLQQQQVADPEPQEHIEGDRRARSFPQKAEPGGERRARPIIESAQGL
jgi:hypothetical protein